MSYFAQDHEHAAPERGSYAATRKHLVERRNALIKSIGFALQAEQMEAHMDLIVRIQKVIDVVDRVIDEEARSPC